MSIRFQPVLVIQTSSRLGHLAVRAALAFWRAALLSATLFVVVCGSWQVDSDGGAFRFLIRPLMTVATWLMWLPWQVGRLVPALQVPQGIAIQCGFEQLVIPSFVGPAGHWAQPSHVMIGNFYLEWGLFFQHMLGCTLTYFVIFMVLAELRSIWRERAMSRPASR